MNEGNNDFIDADDLAIVERIFAGHAPDGYFRFWNYDNLQLDGDYTLDQLKMFVEVMEEMAKRHDGVKHE